MGKKPPASLWAPEHGGRGALGGAPGQGALAVRGPGDTEQAWTVRLHVPRTQVPDWYQRLGLLCPLQPLSPGLASPPLPAKPSPESPPPS